MKIAIVIWAQITDLLYQMWCEMIDIIGVKMKIIIVIQVQCVFISLSIKIIHTQGPCQVATHF